MKLGRWGWDLKRLSLARFQRNRAMGLGEREKNGSQRRCFFVTWNTHHFCHFPRIDFRQTFHEHVSRWRLASRDTWFHIPAIQLSTSESFPLPQYQQWRNLDGMDAYIFQTYSPRGATVGSPICSSILTTARFLVSSFFVIVFANLLLVFYFRCFSFRPGTTSGETPDTAALRHRRTPLGLRCQTQPGHP